MFVFYFFSIRGLVRGGHWISVEWHWGCGVGVAAEGFAACWRRASVVGYSSSLSPMVSSFPLFFLRFFFS
jgi:hypothetical protein